jgi:hypothetical protein
MKSARNLLLAFCGALLCATAPAPAQVVKQMPADALLAFKVSNLEVTSKKIGDFCGNLGLVQLKPELADPLSWFLRDAVQATAGVNRSGELGIFMVDPAQVGGNADHAIFGLLPVSDYQAFLSNYADTKTESGITEIHLHAQASPTYVAHWGDYAVMGDAREYLHHPPAAVLQIPAISAKELDSKDIALYANFRQFRPKALLAIEEGRRNILKMMVEMMPKPSTSPAVAPPTTEPGEMQTNAQKMADMQAKVIKYMPVLRVAVNELLDGAKRFMLDTDGGTFGINISPDGISSTTQLEFVPNSYLAGLAGNAKNSEDTLLTGLPDGKYLVFGGCVVDPKQLAQVFSDATAPIEKAVADMGPDYASVNKFIDLLNAGLVSQDGESVGLLAPTGALGQEAMFQALSIRTGDAKALIDVTPKIIAAQQAMVKSLGLESTSGTTVIIPKAKTLDGVVFDEFQTTMNADLQNPGQAQMMQFMTFLYGPAGIVAFQGMVNDKTILNTMGVSDAAITACITAIRSNDDPIGRQGVVKAVSEQLPAKRAVAIYFPLDIWANTGLNYARMFSMDAGVRIPDDLPPVGVTVSTDNSTVRCDSFIPAQLIQALTSAGMQFYMASHQPAATQPSDKGGL